MRATTLLGVLALAGPAFAAGPADAGKAIYDKHCSQCHGEKGDGQGPAASHLRPRPRDFTAGKYKIRSTPNGALPTDDDLKNIIRRGMPYTSMPAWPQFSDQELGSLVAYLKTFHAAFADASQAPKKLDLGATPAYSKESAEQGGKVYASLGCAGCHGELGRADGPSAPTLKDDAGNPLRAADLTKPWTFRGGAKREDVFRTLSTGLNGTPMPSFLDALKPEERWQLTDHIASLAGTETPAYATLLVASPLEEDIDLAKGAALFEKAKPARFPVVGQIMEPGRAFFPAATDVVVRAVYDQKRIAFLVTWNDSKAETTGKNGPDLAVPAAEEEDVTAAPAAGGDDFWGEAAAPEAPAASADDFWGDSGAASAAPTSEFSDAVAIQLPAALSSGVTKPYFLFGDGQNAADIWFLDLAAGRVRQIVGRGSSALTTLDGSEVEAQGKFEKGEWAAIFVRDLRSSSGVTFAEDQFVPLAFSVWDGGARERGSRRGITQWAYVYVPPRERPSIVVPMAGAAAGVAVLELLVVLALRRRRQAGVPTLAPATNGGA